MTAIPVNFKCSSEFRPMLIFALYEVIRQKNNSTKSPELFNDFISAYTSVQAGHAVYLPTSQMAQLVDLLREVRAEIGECTITLVDQTFDDEEEFCSRFLLLSTNGGTDGEGKGS